MEIIIWDTDEQLPVEELNQALARIKQPKVYQIETNSDQNGIVVAPKGTTQKQAQAAFDAEFEYLLD